MQLYLKDMGYTEIEIRVSEGTGSAELNPYKLSGLDRNYLDVVDKETIIVTEHSKDYELEMANRSLPLKLV